jgi:hypothetical protein
MNNYFEKKMDEEIKKKRWNIFYKLICKIEEEETSDPILE